MASHRLVVGKGVRLVTWRFDVKPDFISMEYGLLFIEKLDWEQVKKLGGKFLQLRLEPLDLSRIQSCNGIGVLDCTQAGTVKTTAP